MIVLNDKLETVILFRGDQGGDLYPEHIDDRRRDDADHGSGRRYGKQHGEYIKEGGEETVVVEERLVTYINSLETGNTEILDEIEREALRSDVPIIRKEKGKKR